MSKKLTSVLLIVLIFTVCIVPMASADITASEYFTTYSSSIQSGGSGKAIISIRATGKVGVNEIGAQAIVLYESADGKAWREVKTFKSDDYPEMMKYGARSISSSVTYNGKSNYHYYATLTFYAGTDGVGDTKDFTTLAQKVS